MEPAQLKTLLKEITQRLKPTTTPDEADAVDAVEKDDRRGLRTCISGFRDMSIGKPQPWDGEHEATFKKWSEMLSSHMAGAGDKVWTKALKHRGRDGYT